MSLVDFITEVFVWVDDALRRHFPRGVRARGPAPVLSDSEVITLELVGEWLRLDADAQIFRHFRAYHRALFPGLARVHRTTFARQAANLWRVKQELQRRLVAGLAGPREPWLVDSFTLPVCRAARSTFCARFAGLARYGYDHAARQTYYGFRLHFRTSRDGLILAVELAPANEHDAALVRELAPPPGSVGVGDRNYWSPPVRQDLLARGVVLLAPFSSKKHDPDPRRSRRLARVRKRIETVLAQWTERFSGKRTWARDLWHLGHRIIRKVFSHTLGTWLCRKNGLLPLQFSRLLDA